MRTTNGRRNAIAGLAALMTACFASSALAGVNRWTTHWPPDALANTVAIDPMSSDVVYAGTTSGVFMSRDGGFSWSDPSNGALDGVNVHCLAIDPVSPTNVYAGTANGIAASNDGGANWSNRLTTSHAIYNLVFGSQHTAYAADFDDVSYYPVRSTFYRSSDDAATWTSSQPNFSIHPGSLVIAPTQSSTLYTGSYEGSSFNTEVRKSIDGGSTWVVSGAGGVALAIDPQNPATIYSASYGGVSKSTDSGSTWSLASGADLADVSVTSLAIDPRNPSTIYAGSGSRGVVRSTDGGASWHDFNTGLPSTSDISALAIDHTGTRLHIAAVGGLLDYQIFSGALDVSVGSDNKARLLFTDPDAHLVFRTVDRAGNSTSVGPYGPYGDWSPTAVADSPDGLTRVLWNNVDGSAALWFYGASGNQASYRLGPVTGWTAVDVAAGAPGTTHILWTHTDGAVGFWAIDNSGRVSYGPKLSPDPGWTAVAIADGADGLTRLLWNKVDGSARLSLVGTGGLLASYDYAGSAGWRAVDVAVGADGQARVLWTHADGRMALYRVDGQGNVTARGPIYDAPAGFTAQRIGAGPDGLTQVLWNDLDGTALLWQMSADNVYQQSFPIGAN